MLKDTSKLNGFSQDIRTLMDTLGQDAITREEVEKYMNDPMKKAKLEVFSKGFFRDVKTLIEQVEGYIEENLKKTGLEVFSPDFFRDIENLMDTLGEDSINREELEKYSNKTVKQIKRKKKVSNLVQKVINPAKKLIKAGRRRK